MPICTSVRAIAGRLAVAGLLPLAALAVAVNPAQASPAAAPCAPNGYCSNRFCTTTTPFGEGNFWFAFQGRNDTSAGWDEFYLVGGTWVGAGNFLVTCPAA